ncbi:MAG: hypothetical protein PHH28_00355 [Desulfuromonadaceae bacterium]|nr:hypothetical protein [Desulfuromonadaceae bacterium]
MSYILDALKKVEHEKNKKVLPGGKINITGDLFKELKQSPPRSGIWKIVVLVVVASLLTCAGTWFLLRGDSKKNTAATRPATPPLVAVVKPAKVPVIQVPAQAQSSSVSASHATPPVPAPVRTVKKSTETISDDDTFVRQERRSKRQVNVESTPPPQQTVALVPAPADIKLSGIAWQEARAARRAVINGFLLKEGDIVSGAKITAIQENVVRFSSAAGTFEIKLGALVPAEVKR